MQCITISIDDLVLRDPLRMADQRPTAVAALIQEAVEGPVWGKRLLNGI